MVTLTLQIRYRFIGCGIAHCAAFNGDVDSAIELIETMSVDFLELYLFVMESLWK